MGARDPQFLSEQARNARKYEKLVRALRKTHELSQEVEQSASFSIADILVRLLPHYVTAFEAQRGFVARRALKKTRGRQFDVIAVEPISAATHQVFLSARIEKLIDNGGARILTPRDLSGVIPELRGFEARSAVLASFRALEHAYLVGLLDKADADKYPFLAGDRRVLESLLSLLALGVRSVERRQRELRMIQEISERIVADDVAVERNGNIWQMIARSASEVSGAPVVGIYSFDEARALLEPRCTWDSDAGQAIGSGVALDLQSASLNGQTARTRRAYYLPDVHDGSQPFLSTEAEAGVRAAYCVPLVSRQQLVGTIYVAGRILDGIAIEQRDAIDRLAPHVAIALHNAQLLERNRQALAIDDDVIEIQQAIADVLQVERQADQLRTVLSRFFPAPSDFFVASYDEESREIRLRVVCERGELVESLEGHPLYQPRQAGTRRGLLEYMLRYNLSLLDVPDLATWPGAAEIEDEFKQDMQCCLIKTLEHSGKLTGFIGFRNFAAPRSFDARHRVLLETIAPHVAIVQHNAHLYGQRIRELEAVSKFQTAITGLSKSEREEIEDVVSKAHKTLRELGLYTGNFYIVLYDAQRKMLRVPVCYERGRLLTVEECERHPAYRTRSIEQRNGLVEWILRNDEPVLTRTRQEIETWRERGVVDLPDDVLCWLGVPMHSRNTVVGVIALRSFDAENLFAESHIPLVATIANQAAITIENARLFQQQSSQQSALLGAAQAIAGAGSEQDSVLDAILKQAVRVTESHLGMLYLKEGEIMKLRSVWPPREKERIRQQYDTVPLNQRSVMARAVRENRAVLESDVTRATEYLDASNDVTRSELAVVLRRGGAQQGDVMGVLNVEHKEVGGLTDNHRRSLISLAHLAVAAIQNAEKATERRRLHTIAVMGVFGADVIHDVKQEVSTIRWAVDRLRNHKNLPAGLLSDLDEIDAAAARMRVPDISTVERSLQSADPQANLTTLDAVIADEVAFFRRRTGIEVGVQLQCGETRVRIQEEWLRRLIRHYLINAQKHLTSGRRARIDVRTVNEGDAITVFVQDNGRGVREDIRHQLFKWEVEHGDKPPGRGLLLVWLITEAHGGRAWLAHSTPGEGACFAFTLPTALRTG